MSLSLSAALPLLKMSFLKQNIQLFILCASVYTCMCSPEDNLWGLVPSFYHVGPTKAWQYVPLEAMSSPHPGQELLSFSDWPSHWLLVLQWACWLKYPSVFVPTNTLSEYRQAWLRCRSALTSQIWERASPLLPTIPHCPYHLIRTELWVIHLPLLYWDHNHWAGRHLISVGHQNIVRN